VVAWAVVPLAAGPVLDDALAGRDEAVRSAASALLWVGWAVGFVAAVVPRSITLTVVRVVVPGAAAAVVWAAVAGEPSTASAMAAGLVVLAAVALAFVPEVGTRFVQGSAYGDERRLLLRPPPMLAAGVVPVAWTMLAGAVVAPVVLLAAGEWWWGGAAAAAGAPLAVLMARSLHGLSRRWVVFVPAGLVLHDGYALDGPVLFPRRLVASLAPALEGTDALDLTAGAAGLALELTLVETVPVVLAARGLGRGRAGETVETDRLLFTPTRPGQVLATAADRRFPLTP
jgi:hypothetical protein